MIQDSAEPLWQTESSKVFTLIIKETVGPFRDQRVHKYVMLQQSYLQPWKAQRKAHH